MKTPNRKPLFLAIAGLSALGVVGSASAVQLSQTGLGQVLVYPYYTVKSTNGNAFNTLLTIVNTTASVKAVKVRFREGKASKEVLDFNLFLSAYDMWVAEVDPDLANGGNGARIFTPDNSCTIPKIKATGEPFRNSLYKGDEVKDGTLARLMEGYVEVFEMATYSDDDPVAIGATHKSNGVPFDCSLVTDTSAADNPYPAQGGLTGTISLVQPGTGLNSATDPVVMAHFKEDQAFYATTGDEEPNFSQAELWAASATNSSNFRVGNYATNHGADAVSQTIMRSAAINEYVLDASIKAATNWVVTFPTKHHYVTGAGSLAPFSGGKLSTNGSCDTITVNLWDREEQTAAPPPGDFSPQESGEDITLCWEANVMLFSSRNIFGSTNTKQIPDFAEHGWAQVGFHELPGLATPNSFYVQISEATPSTSFVGAHTFAGLPVIGFAVETFSPASASSFAGTFPHRWIQPTFRF